MKYLAIFLIGFSPLLFSAPVADFFDPTLRPEALDINKLEIEKAKDTDVQMVFISKNKKFVVVDGEKSEIGGFVGPYRVVQIGNHQLELQTGKSTKTMLYLPNVVENKKTGKQ